MGHKLGLENAPKSVTSMTFKEAARAAEFRMRDIFPQTPLLMNPLLSGRYGAEIWLKREDLSPVRSYKLRGAFNAMWHALANQPDQNLFVCASAGNHAQGVSFMCHHFRRRAVVFMPVTTPQQKVLKTKMFGGDFVDVQLVGDFFDHTLARAQEYCDEQLGHFLAPFDDENVIEGQASVGVEIETALGGAPDHLVIPVGGGGLAAGLVSYFADACGYNFVEPSGARSLGAALESGFPVDVSPIDGFVDGAAVAKIGEKTFQKLKQFSPKDVLSLDEDRICATIMDMLNVEGIVLEPAGAMAIEALSELSDQIVGKQVVCIVSGGNFDFERLPEVKERALRYSGLKKYLILRLPQRPGALKEFLGLLGPDDDIARFEYLKKSARNFGSVLIGIETTDARNFDALFSVLRDRGFAFTDITNDETVAQFVI